MAENYGFEATMLRFVEFGRFRAQNRPKSEVKIWNVAKNVVLLHCQSEVKASALLRLQERHERREAAARCSQSQIESNTIKNTQLWQRFCTK